MAFLTDRTLATGVTLNDLIHIVITGDTSQNPAGSSYKATIGQVLSNVITGTTTNIYNSDGSLTGNRTVSQGSFDLNLNGDENSRFQTFYTSTINPSDNGGITVDVNSTDITHNDDTNDIYIAASLLPGNSGMNVGIISTNESAGISFNSSSASILHYDGTTTTREVIANINGISINQQYYLPNADGTNGQVLTTDGVGNTSWQQIPISSFTGGTVPGETIFSNGLSATTISATTIGSSTDCVDDLYVSNIHSCSPLNINPLDEGNVYFGSTSGVTIDLTNNRVGIGTDSPEYRFVTTGSTGYFYYDGDEVRSPYRQSELAILGPSSGITNVSVKQFPTSGKTIELGMFVVGEDTPNSALWRGFGNSGDTALYASSSANDLNIINSVGSGTTDNINFFVGSSGNLTNSTPDLHIHGSGSTRGYVGIGTTNPTAKLHVSGTSYFDTTGLTTSTIPSFRLLDGVSTPTDTTNIKSFYKEFRPTTTSSNTVVTDGTIIYPNINSSTSAEFYASANLTFFTDDLSDLSSNEALTGEVNLVSIYTNTGTYNGIVKSSSAVLENAIAGGTIDKYVGFWANGLSADITHNGTTNNIYGFYMDSQSGRSGNIPPTTNRYGVYIDDDGRNYFAGTVGIGTTSPSEKLDVSGKTKTINFQMTSGATNGYVLTSDASGNASWQASTGGGGVSIDPYNNVGSTGTSFNWNVSGLSTNYEVTLTANTTLNLSNVRNGDYGTIILTQDGTGGRTLTFGTVNGSATTHRVVNGGGGSPVLTSNASAIDILTFTYNGSTMFWTVGNDYT
jgi:hypothetical protein